MIALEILLLTIFCGFLSWSSLTVQAADPTMHYAGMFTPYAIIPGGGERYFLTTALAFQRAGYFVDILVDENNMCQTLEFLKSTVASLRIDLNYTQLSLKIVYWAPDHTIKGYNRKYDIFFVLGNSKIPDNHAIGTRMNIYMCQFPFDMYEKVSHKAARMFAEYDVVLLNSVYTYTWYAKVIQHVYDMIYDKHLIGPTVKIMYPPVDPFVLPFNISTDYSSSSSSSLTAVNNNGGNNDYNSNDLSNNNQNSKLKINPITTWVSLVNEEKGGKEAVDDDDVINIIMIGRFFVGRQSKGQDRGLRIFNTLVKSTKQKLHLYLVGNIHPSKENRQFVETLKLYAKENELPVTFLNNASPTAIALALSKSTIYWHLTGIQQLHSSNNNKSYNNISSSSSVNLSKIRRSKNFRESSNNNNYNSDSNNIDINSNSNSYNRNDYNSNSNSIISIDSNPQQQMQSQILSSPQLLSAPQAQPEVDDPASLEHFGIAVVEAMAAGCIPIVLNLGGTTDIVKHGMNGYLTDTESGFIVNTLFILSMSIVDRKKLKYAAIETSKKFHVNNFIESFKVMVTRGNNAYMFSQIIKQHIAVIRTMQLPKLSFHSYEKVAVIIEPDIHAHFEFCVRNIIHYLDRSWSIQVHHSNYNEAYVKSVLYNIPFIQYRLLPMRVTSAKEYNVLLKSITFWKSLHTQKVLLFQSDSVLLRYGINKYTQYDYIGAPWDVRNNPLIQSLNQQKILKGAVGNGGFSIRSVDIMLKILNTYGSNSSSIKGSVITTSSSSSSSSSSLSSSSKSNTVITHESSLAHVLDQEDIFFVYYCQRLGSKTCKLANVYESYAFALEVPIKSLDRPKQIGFAPRASVSVYDHLSLHAAWYYTRPRLMKKVLTNMIKAMLISFPYE